MDFIFALIHALFGAISWGDLLVCTLIFSAFLFVGHLIGSADDKKARRKNASQG